MILYEASDLSGNSSAMQIYWIRNRINPPSHDSRKRNIYNNRNKLKLFNDTNTDSVQMVL